MKKSDKITPATQTSNAPQKVLRSLEPMSTMKIEIADTLAGEKLIESLNAVNKFVEALGPDTEYDVLLQVDRRIADTKEGAEDGDQNNK